jgi:NAD(P)-dependent dehydrogenase (short-subunit alcohol dehydrogenase family)
MSDPAGPGIDAAQLDFSAQRVLVTGAAGGIGSAMARAFHAHGATLLLADRDRDAMAALAGELAGAERFGYEQCDAESIARLVGAAGPVDVLLNNAGMLHVGPLLDMPAQAIETMVRTNLLGPILLAQGAARGMVARGRGVIVNTASQIAFTGGPGRAIYGTTKAGLVQFTRAAGAELAPLGVRMVALAPGRSLTPMTAAALADPAYRAQSIARIPAGRLGEAAEMARLALFLASPLAAYVVGETLIADGGYVLT